MLRRRFAPPARDLDRLGVSARMSVADIAAGIGYYALEELRRIGPNRRLLLVDPDRDNLAIARRRLAADPRAEAFETSANSLPGILDHAVDRVLRSLALCGMVDKRGAMDGAWRILRPGGRLLKTYPRLGARWRPRRASLRVTGPIGRDLVGRHDWVELGEMDGRPVRRRLLPVPRGSGPVSGR